MHRLKIGLIGVGAIAGYHLPQLRRREADVDLAVAADVNPAAEAAAKTLGFSRFVTDYRELLEDVDAALVCVPTHLHAGIVVDALRAGKTVFCEKPLARTLEQAQQIQQAAKASNASVQVGFVRRFDPEWVAWRDSIQSGSIGRPVVWRDLYASHGPTGAWFNRDEMGGGPFLDGCIHNLDFALLTFGPVQWVFTHGRTMRSGSTAIDTGSATLHFASGDELLLAWSWGVPAGATGARVFEFLGPGGTITWPRDEPKDAVERRAVVNQGSDRRTEIRFPADALTIAFARQMDEFVEVAAGRSKPSAGVDEGIAALELALAILQSARSTQVVRMDNPTRI